jgi:hypothetical protein
MTRPRETTRRQFFLIGAGAAALLPASALFRSGSAAAAGGQLDEAEPSAAALGYKKDTTQVDSARYPPHPPAQIGAGCRYYQGKAGAQWGPCTIFAGKGAVHSNGWCAAYAAK